MLTLLLVLLTPLHSQAEETYQITPLGTDEARNVDRYQVTIGPGASLWELGFNRLPLIAIEQGEPRVVEVIERSWRAQYPDRGPNELRPNDSFILEVPAGTFVSRSIDRQPDEIHFESFGGDKLTTFPTDQVIQYRLQRAGNPDQAEVLVNGGQADAADEARKIYAVDPPDFLQVRTVRGALTERTAKLTIDLTRKYLDDFRNIRDRATRVEDAPGGLKAFTFRREDQDIPYVRVDDGIGDETDPAKFPRVFRVAYYRDGSIRKYLITETGDSLNALARPDDDAWTRILPTYREWLAGQPEALSPFLPAISNAGSLLPGRILVLSFRPRTTPASPRPTGSSSAGSGADCLGLPLGLLLVGGVVAGRRRVASEVGVGSRE
ncbi:MAG: hypothetical protein IT305_05295 [Chloroflexi bacterium]|nr:hypothetical protein [Chloroflexota bacterium]